MDWQNQAQDMVTTQIERRGITDERVLKVLKETPRHLFVPEKEQKRAYKDYPLPIGEGQTISQPYIVGLMTELLFLTGGEKILEIGTGSGYQTAILSQLVKEVYTLESVCALLGQTQKNLATFGAKNVHVKCGDGYKGWPEKAPFDGILVTAAPKQIPSELVAQLKEGGKMVVPVGEDAQVLKFLIKEKENLKEKDIIPVRFVPMVPGE
jgi:protein-L-isoaspartate(D-aspartate) O-methyltransferase